MTKTQIAEMLRLHLLWSEGSAEGKRADLRGADLGGANLAKIGWPPKPLDQKADTDAR